MDFPLSYMGTRLSKTGITDRSQELAAITSGEMADSDHLPRSATSNSYEHKVQERPIPGQVTLTEDWNPTSDNLSSVS